MHTNMSPRDLGTTLMAGVFLSLATCLIYLLWGKREIITEQFFDLWTNDHELFKCSNKKSKSCLFSNFEDKDLIAVEMEKRRRNRETVETVGASLNTLRRVVSLFFLILVSAVSGILTFKYFGIQDQHKHIFQIPTQFVFELSVWGFALAGWLMGAGNYLCSGGMLTHVAYGLPTFSGKSYLIVFLVSGFGVLANEMKLRFIPVLMETNQLYTLELDNSLYLSYGLVSVAICVLLPSVFFYKKNIDKLRQLVVRRKSKSFRFF